MNQNSVPNTLAQQVIAIFRDANKDARIESLEAKTEEMNVKSESTSFQNNNRTSLDQNGVRERIFDVDGTFGQGGNYRRGNDRQGGYTSQQSDSSEPQII